VSRAGAKAKSVRGKTRGRPRRRILGVTGPAGSGKSTVAEVLTRRGARRIDLDRIGHECLRQEKVQRALRRAFGEEVFDRRGRVRRKVLAEKAFASPRACRKLDAAVHPALLAEARRRIRAARRTGSPATVVGTLLFEFGLDREVDQVIFVAAPFAVRARRQRKGRGWSAEELRRRDRCPAIPEGVKRKRADIVLVNEGRLSRLREKTERIGEEL